MLSETSGSVTATTVGSFPTKHSALLPAHGSAPAHSSYRPKFKSNTCSAKKKEKREKKKKRLSSEYSGASTGVAVMETSIESNPGDFKEVANGSQF